MSVKGIPHAILMTKIDSYGAHDDDLTGIFRDAKVKDLVKTVSDMFGVPSNNVMPVKNYEQEADLETDVNILALLALRRLQNLAMDYLELTTSEEVAADSALEESLMSDTA